MVMVVIQDQIHAVSQRALAIKLPSYELRKLKYFKLNPIYSYAMVRTRYRGYID
jgi:hypothetical protein